MREIKFRAWDGKKIITDFAVINGLCFIETNPKNDSYASIIKNGITETYYHSWATYKRFDYPIMQFTGSKDKNGKETFEGDIWKKDNYEAIITFEFAGWNLKRIDKKNNPYSYPAFYSNINRGEVIGNIHENPEMLEV